MNEMVGAYSISHKVKGYCDLLGVVLVMIFYYVVILSRGQRVKWIWARLLVHLGTCSFLIVRKKG